MFPDSSHPNPLSLTPPFRVYSFPDLLVFFAVSVAPQWPSPNSNPSPSPSRQTRQIILRLPIFYPFPTTTFFLTYQPLLNSSLAIPNSPLPPPPATAKPGEAALSVRGLSPVARPPCIRSQHPLPPVRGVAATSGSSSSPCALPPSSKHLIS
jgi:hypothetical protein